MAVKAASTKVTAIVSALTSCCKECFIMDEREIVYAQARPIAAGDYVQCYLVMLYSAEFCVIMLNYA